MNKKQKSKKTIKEIEQDKETKETKKKSFEYIGKADDFKMPKWMECVWRRVACGRDSCKICGPIKKDRQRHIDRGEDSDSLESVFEDAGRTFKKTLQMIKKDAEKMGIDITNINDIEEPPEPEEFPFYKELMQWRSSVFNIISTAEVNEEIWTHTEAFHDLTWYTNLLPAKVYRQLCNKWHIKQGGDYGEHDYRYTKYVISECLKILRKSFGILMTFNTPLLSALAISAAQLSSLEKRIEKI